MNGGNEVTWDVFSFIGTAVLTGAGGGVIRDLLAGRRPLVFKRNIYVWAAIAGLIVGLGLFKSDLALYELLVLTAALRILSVVFHWKLPNGKIQ